MLTDEVIAEGLRLSLADWEDNAYMSHAATHYAAALREVQGLRPRWTDTPPTVPGWYWWRDEEHMPRIYEVWEYSGYGSLCIGGGEMTRRADTLRGQWAGPIPEPEASNG